MILLFLEKGQQVFPNFDRERLKRIMKKNGVTVEFEDDLCG